MRHKSLVGEKFNRLLVIEIIESYYYEEKRKRYKNRIQYRCLCDCGEETIVDYSNLKLGKTKSCGCITREKNIKRQWRGFNDISGVYYNRLRNDAKKRNIKWDITIEDIWDVYLLQNKKCALSNQNIYFSKSLKLKPEEQTASLDRIDSKKHYILDNIWLVHKDYNVLKWDWSLLELYKMSKNILLNKKNTKEVIKLITNRKGGTEEH